MQRASLHFAVLLILATLPAHGQQIPLLEHGAEHERLDFLIGRWKVQTKRNLPVPLELVGETAFRWDHGGAWLVEEQSVDLEGTGTIHNRMMLTYDRRGERWNGAWWDNVSPSLVLFRAEWRDERTLVLDSGEIDFGGRIHRSVATLTKLDDCTVRRELRWSWDGGEMLDVLESEMRKLAEECSTP